MPIYEFPRDKSVFINCPFDDDFRPLFESIVFSILCCGFYPRCAVESTSSALPRIDRILQAITNSKYSIHDLSRCRGEGAANLGRFNMPLELGMAIMAERFPGRKRGYEHDWLLLVPSGHTYQRFVSDLAGYDPMEHDETPQSVVPQVMSWLETRPDATPTPTPSNVLEALPVFNSALERLSGEWCGRVPWIHLISIGLEVGKKTGLVVMEMDL
ncbi:MAG: hypothetical protein AB1646_01290 [Thermodesulfobacteriota bacterium]